jgi:capsular polysaccharide biosynthesis protein
MQHTWDRRVIVQTREDVELHLHALQTMAEQFQLCEWGHFLLEKLHRFWEITSRSDHGMHLIT